jgi:nucleotide-binding universal stress UspA family protein
MKQGSRIERVLVPLAAGERVGQLLETVERFELPSGVETLLLCVVPGHASRAQLRAAWEHVVKKTRGPRARGQKVDALVVTGDPAQRIVERAVSWRAGLVVMRSRASSGPPVWSPGSVAARVVHEAPVPVLLASPARAHDGGAVRRILVPIDPRRRASHLAVLRLVVSVARRQGSVVQLLAVVDRWDGDVDLVARRGEAEAYLEELHAKLGGIAALRRVVTGVPAHEIARFAVDEDLLAIGVHQGPLGATAEAVLRRCPCALLTVPTP